MAGFRPDPGRHRHRRRAGQGLHDHPQPGAQEAGPAHHRERAPEAHRCRPARSAARGRTGHHLGDRAAARGRPPRPCGGHRRLDRWLRAHEPGGIPGPPREDRHLQRVRAARPSRRAAERRLAAGPRAPRDRRRALRGRPGAGQRPDPPGRRPVRGRRWRDDGRGARPPWRHRGDADVRARWPRLHEEHSPTGWTCRSLAPSRSRWTTPVDSAGRPARYGVGDHRRRCSGLGGWRGAGDGGTLGWRPAAGQDLPVRRWVAPAGDRRGARRPRRSGATCRSPARPR